MNDPIAYTDRIFRVRRHAHEQIHERMNEMNDDADTNGTYQIPQKMLFLMESFMNHTSLTHTHTHTHTHSYTYQYVHTCTHTCTHIPAHTPVYTQTGMCTFTLTREHTVKIDINAKYILKW